MPKDIKSSVKKCTIYILSSRNRALPNLEKLYHIDCIEKLKGVLNVSWCMNC